VKPTWRRIGSEIIILTEWEYRFHWTDTDMASALYLLLLAEREEARL
jgi:hypothetical protein